jgi:hypothetical protein
MKPFVSGARERYGEEENYASFQNLYEKIVQAEKGETE